MGVRLSFNPAHIVIIVLLIIIVSGCVYSTFSLIVGCIAKTRERFMGIGQVLTMPIFFALVTRHMAWLQFHWKAL